ncbi:MAG: hypothetical protein KGL12_10745 [Rhodospirillales bacterium]|nr:hypothetical protein [Rhodospirillales bacterium]
MAERRKTGLLRRLARRGYTALRTKALPACLAPLGWFYRRDQLRASWPDGAALAGLDLGPRIALFCHFDAAGALDPAVPIYLAALAEAGFTPIVISNAGYLTPAAEAGLRGAARAVLLRANRGHDFGAWAEAMRRLALPRPETEAILLVNDSVLGPIGPLGPVLARLDPATADLWGLTDCAQLGWHLQSYFLLAGRRALASPEWARFWAGLRPVPSKRWTIWQGEVAFSRRMQRAGLRLAALWPTQGDAAHPPNPTTDCWEALLRAGFPFLKKEVLRDDPGRTGAAASWRQAVAARGPVDPAVLAAMAAELRAKSPASGEIQASGRR